jgi:hypothetical protein
MFILLHFEAKQKNWKQNKKIFGSETKQKYALLILLRPEAKRSGKTKILP